MGFPTWGLVQQTFDILAEKNRWAMIDAKLDERLA